MRIYENLMIQYQDFENQIKAINPELITKKTSEAEWSVAEVVEHLVLTEEGMAKVVGSSKGSVDDKPRIYDTEKLLRFFVNREVKIKAPTMVLPVGNVTSVHQGLAMIHANRMRLQEAIDNGKINWAVNAVPHPILGELNKREWFEILILHMERHRLQIEEIISTVK